MLARIENREDLAWCVLRTEPRQERKAANALAGHRVEVRNFELRHTHLRKGKKLIVHESIFPGYLFAKLPIHGGPIWGKIAGYYDADAARTLEMRTFLRRLGRPLEIGDAVPLFEGDGERRGVIGGIMKSKTPWIMRGAAAATVSDEVIAGFDELAAQLLKPVGSRVFVIGQRVKVLDGPFQSYFGAVESLDGAGRVKLLLDLLGRKTSVEMEEDQVIAA